MATYNLTKETIRLLATLSRLPLSDAEMQNYLEQLKEIIQYVTRIKQLKTAGVAPTFNSSGLTNVFQTGHHPRLTLSQNEALSQSRHSSNGYFEAPSILEHR